MYYVTKSRTGWITLTALVWLASGCIGDALISVSGEVRDQSGSPVSGADVSLTPAPGSDIGRPAVNDKTDQLGRFYVMTTFNPSSKKRRFILRVRKDGFLSHKESVPSDGDHRRQIMLKPETGNEH